LRSKSLIIKGHIDDLDKAYSEVRVVVAAHQYSGGIPLKIYEALSHGVPCVISNLLAKQMNINEMQGVAIASCADDFIEKSINLYNDEVLWEQKSKNALEFIETFHSGLEWENTIREVLKKFSAN
jgi:glycosyltransferase involved in cell wall biosynthesis